MLRLGLFLAAMAHLSAAGAQRPSVPSSSYRPSDRAAIEWREGPVRYIITAEEDREYKQIASEEARRRFIERFWARRDPVPGTLVNEYRMEFWNRVAQSNQLFTDSAKPGWKTDMGRFHILLGPPDDRDTSRETSTGMARAGVRSVIEWRYTHAPNPRIGTGVRIIFTKDPSGEYRAERDERIVQQILDGALGLESSRGVFSPAIPDLPPHISEMQLMLDLGRLEEVPSEEDLLTAIVTAREYFGAIPFSARYDFFAGHNATIAAITLSLHPDPLDPQRKVAEPDYLIVGRIDASEPEGAAAREATFLHEDDFLPGALNADPGFRGPYLYQAVVQLPPGRYRISFAAFDRASRRTGTHVGEVEVPGFPEDVLALSSLCLSDRIEQVPDRGRVREAYVIGSLRVTPRLLPVYRNGDTFAVYYQIYSALNDPLTHSPSLQIEYQFFVNQGGAFVPIGRPIRFDSVGNSAQGWSFPLRDWPNAEFNLRVSVTDSLTGQSASREITFRVQ